LHFFEFQIIITATVNVKLNNSSSTIKNMKLTKPSKFLVCIALCSLACLPAAATTVSPNAQPMLAPLSPVAPLTLKSAEALKLTLNDAQKADEANRPSHGEPGMDTALVAFFGGTYDCQALLGAEGQSGDGLDPAVSGRLAAVLDATAAKGTKTIDTLNMLRATCAHHQNQEGGAQ
jgi:hypothetical protein